MNQLSPNKYDVIVIGSGPAGTSAAYILAKAEYNVLIIDKEFFPRYKTCGGGIVSKISDSIPVDLKSFSECVCYKADIFDHKTQLKFTTVRSKPLVFMTMRSNFDKSLLTKAIESGADFLENCELLTIEKIDNSINLNTNKGVFKSKYCIAADGVSSLTAKKLNWNDTRRIIPALEYELYVNEKTMEVFSKSARFDFGIVPHGYAWVFPKNNHLSAGLLYMGEKKINLNKYMQFYLNKINLNKYEKIERHGYRIPIRPRQGSFVKDNVFLVGDSAGFTDPITAEGISYAVSSGQLAALSIIEAEFDFKLAEKFYNDKIKNIILQELDAAKFFSFFIYSNSKLREWIFKLYGEKLSELITDVIIGEKKYSQLIKEPGNYLKLLTLWFHKNRKGTKETTNIRTNENI